MKKKVKNHKSLHKNTRKTKSVVQKKQTEVKPSVLKTEKKKKDELKIGRTVLTKDCYLPNDPKKSKQLKEKRVVVIIDKNTNKELAIVRLTTQEQKNTTELKGYTAKGQKVNSKKDNGQTPKTTFFKHFVEIYDNENNPITIDNVKFILRNERDNLTSKQVKQITKKVYGSCKQAGANRLKRDKLKK